MILAFSGTGNSRYAAERIAAGAAVTDLNALLRCGEAPPAPEDGQLVVVSPTYAWRLPRVVERAVRAMRTEAPVRAWFVMTCGDGIGNAGRYNRRLCADMGFACMGTAAVVMPENYLVMFDVPDREAAAGIVRAAEPALDAAAKAIRLGQAFPEPRRGAVDALKSGLVNPVFYAAFVRASAFRTTDACVGCGHCAEVCPLNNIRLEHGRPVWGSACTHCMACVCRCPKVAVEYGKRSVGRNRYVCGRR